MKNLEYYKTEISYTYILLCSLLAFGISALQAQMSKGTYGTFALKNATIHTVTNSLRGIYFTGIELTIAVFIVVQLHGMETRREPLKDHCHGLPGHGNAAGGDAARVGAPVLGAVVHSHHECAARFADAGYLHRELICPRGKRCHSQCG